MSIYVFDIDGTISKNGLRVHQVICDRISALAKTNQVIFASARPVRDMLPMLSEELHSSVLIGCNGGMAWEKGSIILSHTLNADFVCRLLTMLNKLEIPYVLDGEWNYAISISPHPFHEYIRSLSDKETSEKNLLVEGVTKVLVLSGEYKHEILSHTERDNVSVHAHRSDGFYDFTPEGNNKYRTLSELIGNRKFIAFGNDQNDHLMLENASISVFVGDKNYFEGATYYTSTDYIPTLLNHIESNIVLMESAADGTL